MKINLHSPIEEAPIQIIPLIDVFLYPDVFLLAALQFTRQQAISVDLPKASTGTTPQMRQMLIITLDSIGQIYVEQQPVGMEELSKSLQAYRRLDPNVTMVLNASRTSSYNDVEVLDRMRQVGDRVALATLRASPISQLEPLTPYFPSAPGSTAGKHQPS